MSFEGSFRDISSRIARHCDHQAETVTPDLSPSLRQPGNNQHGANGEGNIGDRPGQQWARSSESPMAPPKGSNSVRSVATAAISLITQNANTTRTKMSVE
jgi:hypothetical protein